MTYGGVDETNSWFTLCDTGVIHHGQDSTDDRRSRGSSVHELENTIDSNVIVRSVGRKIGICTGLQEWSTLPLTNCEETYRSGRVVDILRVRDRISC